MMEPPSAARNPGTGPLPTGTVTFVLTDMEGSTRLWQHYHEAMRLALVRHDTLIEQVVAEHGGHLVRPRGEGDSRFAVFARASDALSAACAIQVALSEEPWGLPEPVRVRIGVHTGEADLQSGDYYGPAVNHCARLRAAAHGGQIVVSSVTADLVREAPPSESYLRDLGEHHLRDLNSPERIWQVVHPQLQADFPPLSSLNHTPANVPSQLSSFVGRQETVDQLHRLLLTERLLTLTGPGGIGKTRLAIALADSVLQNFPDGVWLVELASLSDGGLIPNAIAQAAGIQEQPGRSIGGTIAAAFSPRAVLIVLDNCEHIVDACAAVATDLLGACPQLRIVATSRQSLHVSGEFVYRVPTLSVPAMPRESVSASGRVSVSADPLSFAAVQLFLERAQAVQPEFALTHENSDSIASICARLDGLPLAIELAAAWVRVLSAAQILERLDNLFGLLVGGNLTAPTRQQTLHATLEWSFRQLGEDERQLFMCLAVFTGGFDLDALRAVWSGGDALRADPLHVLNTLVDKSLVQVFHGGDAVRFRLLEPVRQFADLRLVENGGGDAERARHALHFVGLAERAAPLLLGAEGAAWFDRLDQEIDNFRAALEYFIATGQPQSAERMAGKLWPFWLHRSHWTEGIQFLRRVLGMSGADAPTIWRANSLLGLSHLIEVKGDHAAARALFLETSELQRELGDDAGLARSLVRLGALATYDPDRTSARQALQEALSLTHSTGQRSTRVSALLGLARLSLIDEDVETAQAHIETALTVAKDLGWTFGIAQALRMLGELRSRLGDHAGARLAYEESLRGSRTVQDSLIASATLGFLGSLAMEDGDYTRAQALLAEALTLHREMGDAGGLMWVLFAFAGLRAAQGRPETALRLASAGMAMSEKLRIRLLPRDNQMLERWLAPASQALSTSEAEAARTAGKQLPVDEAITLALAG